MKLRKLIALFAALVMLCSVLPLGAMLATAEAVEAMTNGDLETGDATGFAAVNGTSVTTAKAHGGKYALKATNTSGVYSTMVKSAPIAVQPNTEYTASLWYYYSGSHATPAFYIFIKDEGNSKNIASTTINPAEKNTWTKVSVKFNSGSNEKLLFLVQNKTASDGGTYYIDDLSLACDEADYVDPNKTERVTNGDLEAGSFAGFSPVSGTSLSSTKAHSGSHSMKATNTASMWGTLVKSSGLSVRANTEYTASFWYYCDSAYEAPGFYLFLKDGNNSTNIHSLTIDVTTKNKWIEVSCTFNTGNNETILFLLQNKAVATGGTGTYYFDDISVIGPDPNGSVGSDPTQSPDVPGNKVQNGTFETGDNTGWSVAQGSAVSADAKVRGNYGMKLTGNGGWGGMAAQDVAVEAGKTYVVSAQMKTVAVGANVQIKDGSSSGTLLATEWFTKTDWTRVSYTVTPTTNTLYVNFCGGGNGSAETVYVDDVVVMEQNNDGYIINGNFEVGETNPWTVYQGTAVSTDAAYSSFYGLHMQGDGGWGSTAYQDFATEVGKTYAFTARMKAVTSGVNVQIVNVADGTKIQNKWFNTTSWTNVTLEFTATGTTTRLNFCGSGSGVKENVYVDNVVVYERKPASFDGWLYNGDFETGTKSNYTTYQSTEITPDAAHSGLFGCKASGVGNWGATIYQDLAIDPGKTYKISFWYKVISTGMNFGVCTTNDKENIISDYLSDKSEWTLYEKEFQSGYLERVRVKFHCTGKGTIDEIYVDDLKIECLSGEEMDRKDNLDDLGVSIRDTQDNTRGLAFAFDLDAKNTQVKNVYEMVPLTGSVQLYEYGTQMGDLVEAGAVVSNAENPTDLTLDSVDNLNTIKIPAKYLLSCTPDSISYAVRVINIPDRGTATEIYARPYYTYLYEGETVTVYGDTVHQNYDAVDSVRTRKRVLAIGDERFTDKSKTYLYEMLQSAGYDQVILGTMSQEGSYADALNNDSATFSYEKYDEDGTYSAKTGVSALKIASDEKWDAVVVDLDVEATKDVANAISWALSTPALKDAEVLVHSDTDLPMAVDIVPTGVAVKNLATVLKGTALTDDHRDYTAALTWYLAVTGESLDNITVIPTEVRDQYFNMGRAAAHAIVSPNKVTDISETLLLAGSDYQPANWSDGPPIVEKLIASTMANGTKLYDGFFAGGDYASMVGFDVSTIGSQALDGIVSKVVYGNKIFVEGNHDDPAVELIDEYGPNDPLGGTYGAFVINEEHYVAYGSKGEEVAADLTTYLNEKIGNKSWGNKPIFILSHIPLHYSRRTVEEGCATGALPILEALNKGGEAGLNIIFLFAHNHGSGHDDHIGGGSVYLKKGDTMPVCTVGGMNSAPVTKQLKFTYMNYGYINNYADHGSGVDKTLTMTTFRIRADGAVIITRYDQNGVHNLKSEGKKNVLDGQYVVVNSTVYESSRIVTATDDQPYKE